MSKFKQGDKIKVIDTRSDAEKNRVVIGQGERRKSYGFSDGEESAELKYGEIFKVSTSTTAKFVNRSHSIPLIEAGFANENKNIFELVEATDSDES